IEGRFLPVPQRVQPFDLGPGAGKFVTVDGHQPAPVGAGLAFAEFVEIDDLAHRGVLPDKPSSGPGCGTMPDAPGFVRNSGDIPDRTRLAAAAAGRKRQGAGIVPPEVSRMAAEANRNAGRLRAA